MGGQERIAMDVQREQALGPSQDTEDDVVEEGAGHEEMAPLEGALGDFDEASGFRNVAWHSHAKQRRIFRSGSFTFRQKGLRMAEIRRSSDGAGGTSKVADGAGGTLKSCTSKVGARRRC